MSMSFLGRQIDAVWHTGVIVFGKEWFFSGGIRSMEHQAFIRSHGLAPITYLDMGETEITEAVFREFLMSISPRFTAATYNLLRHNCNNFSNEVCQFLLSKPIPEHIINLPNEVLSSPLGGLLRPMLEQMEGEMSGGDPLASQEVESVYAAATGHSREVQPAAENPTPHHYPLLDSHTKPLLSTDASGVVASIVRLLRGAGASLPPEEQAVLASVAECLKAGVDQKPLPVGGIALLTKLLKEKPELEFSLLNLMRLVALRSPPSDEVREELQLAISSIIHKLSSQSMHTAQGLTMGLCTVSNLFATEKGTALVIEDASVLDTALTYLHNASMSVRQVAAALVFNYALALSQSKGEAGVGDTLPEEATQILLASLEGIDEEKCEVVALRRLMAAGVIMKRYGVLCSDLVRGCEFGEAVKAFASPGTAHVHKVANELVRLIGN